LAQPPAFTPPKYVVWVNSLFFLSGVFSVAAALSAILRQEWAKRYIMVTQQQSHTPHLRARIRAIFVADTRGPDIVPGSGMVAFFLPLSLFCFVGGGLIYLININRFVLGSMAWLVVLGLIDYAQITVKPIFKHNTLFYGPFSPLMFRLYLGTLYVVFKVCSYIAPLHRLCIYTRKRYHDLRNGYREGFFSGKQKAAEDMIPTRSTKLDADILDSTLQSCLGKDDELEMYFKVIPGFFDSKVIKNLKDELPDAFRTKFCHALHGFLGRTFASDSISESVRSSQVLTCLNAARAVLSLDQLSRVLDNIFSTGPHGPHGLQSVEVEHSMGRWGDKRCSSAIRRMVTDIVSHVRERDPPWIAFIKDAFGILDIVIDGYDGDSVALAILIRITDQLRRSDFPSWGPDILRQLPSFDIRDTLPSLQQDFCALWDNIVQESRGRGDGSNPSLILKEIHHFYIALRQGTDTVSAACSDSIANDDNSPFVPSCGPVDRGPDSNPSFPAAEPTSSGDPISASSHHAPLEVQDLFTSLGVVASAVTPQSNVDLSAISCLANATPFPPSRSVPTFQGGNNVETTPPCIVHGSPSIPVPMSVVSKDIISAPPRHLSIDTAVSRTVHIPHTLLESTSTSAPAPAAVLPQSSRVLDENTTRTIGTASTHDDSHHQNPPLHLNNFRHS
jgi:hypothetical protein